MELILERVLVGDPTPRTIDGVMDWWTHHQQAAGGFSASIDRAIAGGFAADRLGYAFASGYTEALARLVPEVAGARTALCATEGGAAHPSAMRTALTERDGELRLDGHKSFVTLGAFVEQLLVVATTGTDDRGRNRLSLVRIPADRAGVTLEDVPPVPFVPEIPHAAVRFAAVEVAKGERLPGDGYDRYLKPFRTVEDLHVHGALLGWLLQVGRRCGWDHAHLERLAAALAAAGLLADGDPSRPEVHIALAGLIADTAALIEIAEWYLVDDETRLRWERDRGLLQVAGKARVARREAAWRRQ